MNVSRGLCILLLILNAAARAADDPRAVLQNIGFDQNLGRQLPLDLKFTNENGDVVSLSTYFAQKPVILTLVYHDCPMLCGAELHGLITCLRPMTFTPGNEFNILTVSFNPDETTTLSAAKKAEYIKEYGRPNAAAGWHFLTGNKDSIETLTKAVGFRYRYDEASKQFAHASGIVLVTPEGKTSRYFYGVEYYPRELKLGLIEASQNRIGNLTDQVLLYCYRYDPMTGRYGIVILNVLRVAGLLTVFCLGTFMTVMFLRDKRMNHIPKSSKEAT